MSKAKPNPFRSYWIKRLNVLLRFARMDPWELNDDALESLLRRMSTKPSGKLIPNTTPLPNFLIDQIAPKLSSSSLRVLLAICRKTYGFHKRSDKLSFNLLQKLTGLSRPAVNKGIKGLGPLLKIVPGVKNSPTIAGVTSYEINLDISTEELVNELYWLKKFTSKKSASELVNKVNSTKENTKESMQTSQLGKPIAQDGHPKKNVSSAAPGLPGFKEAVAVYHDLFFARFGAKPDIDGRDGKLLAGLVRGHGADEVQGLLRFFFEHPPDWVEKKGKFTIATFKWAYNELLAQSRNGKMQMGIL